jgi:hypothetical protein
METFARLETQASTKAVGVGEAATTEQSASTTQSTVRLHIQIETRPFMPIAEAGLPDVFPCR